MMRRDAGRRVMLAAGAMLAALAAATAAADDGAPPAVYGRYANSMLIRTRTAATYPQGLRVFTLVALWQDFTERRDAATGGMTDLPAGVERRQLNAVGWAEYGITDRVQVGLAVPWLSRDFRNPASGVDETVDGVGDASLYAKCRLLAETRTLPALALDGFVKAPTGDEHEGTGNGEWDTTLGLALSKRRGCLSAHLNPEYTITGGSREALGASADDRVAVHAGLMYHASAALVPMLEWNALWWGDVGEQHELGAGALWFPARRASVKLGVSVPLSVDMPWAVDWTPWVKLACWF